MAYEQLSDLGINGPFYFYEGGVEDWKKNGEKLDFMKDISADDLVQKINKGNVEGVVIDVRNENETQGGYYLEAILLPMNKIRTHAFKALKPQEFYYVHC